MTVVGGGGWDVIKKRGFLPIGFSTGLPISEGLDRVRIKGGGGWG